MERLSKEQIRSLPLYEGVPIKDIHVIKNKWAALKAVKILEQYTVLGFDTESKPTFKKGEVSKGPHLIQLSCPEKTYLFPTRFVPAIEEIKVILSNPNIKKVGFGVSGDKATIYRNFGINLRNTEDLSQKVKKFTGLDQRVGARAAVAMLFKLRLSKSAQKSNWALFPLEEHQIKYAANDAYSALCVELEIERSNAQSTN